LLNVWLSYQLDNDIIRKEDIKEIPYFQIGGENWPKKIVSFLGAKFKGKKYKKSF